MGVEYICVVAIYIRECLCDTFAFPIFCLLFFFSRCAMKLMLYFRCFSISSSIFCSSFFLNVLFSNRELHHCDLNQMSFELYFTTLIFHSNDFDSDFT